MKEKKKRRKEYSTIDNMYILEWIHASIVPSNFPKNGLGILYEKKYLLFASNIQKEKSQKQFVLAIVIELKKKKNPKKRDTDFFFNYSTCRMELHTFRLSPGE